jgi:hypothetical protein
LASNGGVSSDTTTGMLARINRDVIAFHPHICVLGDATNDINTAVSTATIRANIKAMAALLIGAGIIPVVRLIYPRNDTAPKAQSVREHNLWLARWARANGYPIVDTYTPAVDPTNGNLQSSYTSDGIHVNTAAAITIGKYALNSLTGWIGGHATNPPFLPYDNSAAPSMLTNGLFINDINSDGVADNWLASGTYSSKTIATPDATALAAGVAGKVWTLVISSGTPWVYAQLTVDGSNLSVGDRLSYSGRIAVTGASGNLNWDVGMEFISESSAYFIKPLQSMVSVDYDWATFLCEATVPAGSALVRFGFKGYAGTGTVNLAQHRAINLTKLGIVTP